MSWRARGMNSISDTSMLLCGSIPPLWGEPCRAMAELPGSQHFSAVQLHVSDPRWSWFGTAVEESACGAEGVG